jgi:hypothetical protein
VTPGLAYDLLAVKYRQHTGYLQCILFFSVRDVKLYLVRAVAVLNSDERVSGIIAMVCPTSAELARLPDSYSSTASTTVTICLARREAESRARWCARSVAIRSSQSSASCSQVRDRAACVFTGIASELRVMYFQNEFLIRNSLSMRDG